MAGNTTQEQYSVSEKDRKLMLRIVGIPAEMEKMLYEQTDSEAEYVFPSIPELIQAVYQERQNLLDTIARNTDYITGYFSMHPKEDFLQAREIRNTVTQCETQHQPIVLTPQQRMAIFEATILEAKATEIQECNKKIQKIDELTKRIIKPQKEAKSKKNPYEQDR